MRNAAQAKAGEAGAMDITPPFGYSDVIPLERHHKVLLPAVDRGTMPAYARSVNAMAISFSEFAVAQRDYPIVFSTVPSDRSFAPVAVLGLADGQNLFIDRDGAWEPGHYVPAFVRRYPFCVSRVYIDGVIQPDRLVCVERSWIDQGGIAMFDDTGIATPEWTERERLLAEYERDIDLTARMCARLVELDLLVPFTMQIKSGAETALTMQGMHCIDESRFSGLAADVHRELAQAGMAARIYAHLFSLGNFSRLLERAQALAGRPAVA
ncbi:MAG: SapC family protein [Burkholderiales bacterium]|nr:SapC family protein [Burkholderiales bacterium]